MAAESSIKDPILDHVVRAVPQPLFTWLSQRLDAAYEEAAEYAKNGPWSSAEAQWMRPPARRAVMEGELRKAAESCGLRAFNLEHDNAGCSYVLVRSGVVSLTCHYVGSPTQGPRFAVARKQNAGVNEWCGGYLAGALTEEPPPLDGNPVYVYALHGEQVSDHDQNGDYKNRFLRVAVPTWNEINEREILLRNWSINEVLAAYEILSPVIAPAEEEDAAKPKLKQIAKERDAVG